MDQLMSTSLFSHPLLVCRLVDISDTLQKVQEVSEAWRGAKM